MNLHAPFDKKRLYYSTWTDSETGETRMRMHYRGLQGYGDVPKTVMTELHREAHLGQVKNQDYYFSEEFVQRCIIAHGWEAGEKALL